MICAVLLPSRARRARLRHCVQSFVGTGIPGQFEILIATDDDDKETLEECVLLEREFSCVHILEGQRGGGWYDLHLRYTGLADCSEADWVWMMNDDCEVRGPWLEEIAKCSSGILHPEIHELGKSRYRHDLSGAFPIVRNDIWRDWGFDGIGDPPDKWLNETAAANGLPVHFLSGVEISHQRIVDEILPASRL